MQQLPSQVVFPKDLILLCTNDASSRASDYDYLREQFGFSCVKVDSYSLKNYLSQPRVLMLILDHPSTTFTHYTECSKGMHGVAFPVYCKQEECVQAASTLFKESVEKIHFYERNEPFYWMTNFYESRFTCDNGIQWPTSEHFFQAQKFSENLQVMKQISQLSTPRAAFDFARDSKNAKLLCNVDRWRTGGNVKAMERALEFKFSQNVELLQQLLLTSPNCQLVEHTTNDNFWGDGGNGGENKLGKLLMQLREKTRQELNFQNQQQAQKEIDEHRDIVMRDSNILNTNPPLSTSSSPFNSGNTANQHGGTSNSTSVPYGHSHQTQQHYIAEFQGVVLMSKEHFNAIKEKLKEMEPLFDSIQYQTLLTDLKLLLGLSNQ